MAATLAIVIASMGIGCGSTSSTETSSVAESTAAASTEAAATEEAPTAESSSAEGTEAGEEDLYGEEVTINVMDWDRGSAAPGTTTEDNAMTQWIQE